MEELVHRDQAVVLDHNPVAERAAPTGLVVVEHHTLPAVVDIRHLVVHWNLVGVVDSLEVVGSPEVDSPWAVDSLLEEGLGCIDEELDCIDRSEDHSLAEESLRVH